LTAIDYLNFLALKLSSPIDWFEKRYVTMYQDERTDEATADEWKPAWTDDIGYFELLRWFRDLI